MKTNITSMKSLLLLLVSLGLLLPLAHAACDKSGMGSEDHKGKYLQVYIKILGNDSSNGNPLYTLTDFDKSSGNSSNEANTATELEAGVEYAVTHFTLQDGGNGVDETVTYKTMPYLVKLTGETAETNEFSLRLKKKKNTSNLAEHESLSNKSSIASDPDGVICLFDPKDGETGDWYYPSGENAQTYVVIDATNIPYGVPAGHIKIIYPVSGEYATTNQTKFIDDITSLISPKFSKYFDTSQALAVTKDGEEGSFEAALLCSSDTCINEIN